MRETPRTTMTDRMTFVVEVKDLIPSHPDIVDVGIVRSGNQTVVAVVATELANGPELRDIYIAALGMREARNELLLSFVMTVPRNEDGSIDELALCRAANEAGDRFTFDSPQSETEHAVHTVFTEVFEREVVSVTDHFLDLGGDSLM